MTVSSACRGGKQNRQEWTASSLHVQRMRATPTRNWGCSVVIAFCAAGPAGRGAQDARRSLN